MGMANTIKVFFKELIGRISEHRIGLVAGQVAYFFTLTLFPMMIFINAVVGLLHISGNTLIEYLSPFLPTAVIEVLGEYLSTLSTTSSVTALSVGALITLFTASRAVYAITFAVDRAYGVKSRKGFIRTNFYAMLFMLGIGGAIIVSMVLASFGRTSAEWVNTKLGYELFLVQKWGYLRWIIVLAMLTLVLGALHYVLPNKKQKLSVIMPGTVFSMLCWMALVWGFSIYINNFLIKWGVYGPLGAIIVLMVWLYLVGWIIILGAEINQTIVDIKNKTYSE